MPWNKNSGKGGWNQGGGQGPWGGPSPGGSGSGGGGRKGGGDQPPDLEQILRRGQERLRKVLPSGAPGGSVAGIGALVIAGFWLASGFYQVGAGERGVVQRFGKFEAVTNPGLQWHLPWPIETARILQTQEYRKVLIGGEADPRQNTSGVDESLMLTGDRNFLKVKFVVQYRVRDPREFLFNVKDAEDAVRTSAQSAMREVVGRGSFDQLQTEQRTATAEEVRQRTQAALNSYNTGIEVAQVNIDSVDPPEKALQAARDVQTARQEKETLRNQAEAYQNNKIPTARGQAERLVKEAEAYKQRVVADAQGETQRFLSVYEQYKKAPEVTRKRMYIETLEQIFGGTNKVLIDRSAQGGVLPYLPLGDLTRAGTKPPATSNPPAGVGGN